MSRGISSKKKTGGWLTLLSPVAEVFELVTFIGFVGFWVWMAAMGVAVWRTPEQTSA